MGYIKKTTHMNVYSKQSTINYMTEAARIMEGK